MDINAQKEEFSHAYVLAVAAVSGFCWSKQSTDDDSIDLTIHQKGGGGTIRSPRLDLQLKCHAAVTPTEVLFQYPVKIKNYDDLRPENVMTPRILVVVLVPDDPADWLSHSEEELAIRRCGYWVSLRGMPETTNTSTVTLNIPRMQLFNPDGLRSIMSRIESGSLP